MMEGQLWSSRTIKIEVDPFFTTGVQQRVLVHMIGSCGTNEYVFHYSCKCWCTLELCCCILHWKKTTITNYHCKLWKGADPFRSSLTGAIKLGYTVSITKQLDCVVLYHSTSLYLNGLINNFLSIWPQLSIHVHTFTAVYGT